MALNISRNSFEQYDEYKSDESMDSPYNDSESGDRLYDEKHIVAKICRRAHGPKIIKMLVNIMNGIKKIIKKFGNFILNFLRKYGDDLMRFFLKRLVWMYGGCEVQYVLLFVLMFCRLRIEIKFPFAR
jgi:hypothetical protein